MVQGPKEVQDMTQNNEPDDVGDDDSGIEGFTPEQIRAIVRLQNSGQTARFAKANKQALKQFENVFQSWEQKFLERIGSVVPGLGGNGESVSDGEEPRVAKTDSATDKRLAQMERELQKSRKLVEEERKLREEQAANTRRVEERGALESALRSSGCKPELLKSTAALLYTEEKRIDRDESGKIVFRMMRDGYQDDLDLESGVAEWLRSPEGKHYAMPKTAAGSGATGGKPGQRSARETKADLKALLVQQIIAGSRGED